MPGSSGRYAIGKDGRILRRVLPGDEDADQLIPWPEGELAPLANLNGSAVVAANAALQRILARYKDYPKGCLHSPRAFRVIVWEQSGMYFVRIRHPGDRCGLVAPPEFELETDWFELYAVSPDGQVLARYPYCP